MGLLLQTCALPTLSVVGAVMEVAWRLQCVIQCMFRSDVLANCSVWTLKTITQFSVPGSRVVYLRLRCDENCSGSPQSLRTSLAIGSCARQSGYVFPFPSPSSRSVGMSAHVTKVSVRQAHYCCFVLVRMIERAHACVEFAINGKYECRCGKYAA